MDEFGPFFKKTVTYPLELVEFYQHDCLLLTQMSSKCFSNIRDELKNN